MFRIEIEDGCEAPKSLVNIYFACLFFFVTDKSQNGKPFHFTRSAGVGLLVFNEKNSVKLTWLFRLLLKYYFVKDDCPPLPFHV